MTNLPMTPDLNDKQTIELGVAIPAAFFIILFTALTVHANRDHIDDFLHRHKILIPLQPRPTRGAPFHYQPTAPPAATRAPPGAYPENEPCHSQTHHARRQSTLCPSGDASSDEFPLHEGTVRATTLGPSNTHVEDEAPRQSSAAKEYGRELRTRFHSPTPPPAYTPARPARVE
ncbi:hypothetical protein IW261DRAFT_1571215 [Armillaria novae-zelandiae]|uniref:Transmembrane protein n=1 Tax=Armillaria novae-zelandiae TaxID=153914 RepID=A0AA39U1C7_9AGAR|nr:hypothetical protein IW261DRAFT_1571215 [Armillaria novae-zelandiae]